MGKLHKIIDTPSFSPRPGGRGEEVNRTLKIFEVRWCYLDRDSYRELTQSYSNIRAMQVIEPQHSTSLTDGIGNERSQKGSKVTEAWLQVEHVSVLRSCPTNKSKERKVLSL